MTPDTVTKKVGVSLNTDTRVGLKRNIIFMSRLVMNIAKKQVIGKTVAVIAMVMTTTVVIPLILIKLTQALHIMKMFKERIFGPNLDQISTKSTTTSTVLGTSKTMATEMTPIVIIDTIFNRNTNLAIRMNTLSLKTIMV